MGSIMLPSFLTRLGKWFEKGSVQMLTPRRNNIEVVDHVTS
jgi:hypothetical protein